MTDMSQLHGKTHYMSVQDRCRYKDKFDYMSKIEDQAGKMEAFVHDLSYPVKPYARN